MTRSRRHGGRRKPRASRGSFAGRLLRGVLEFVLIVVLLFFAASLFGLLDHGGRQAARPIEQAWDPRRTEVVPAVVDGFEEAGFLPGRAFDGIGGRRPEVQAEEAGRAVRLHIANGCGVGKLASRAGDIFREAGFDVRSVSNADTCGYRETIVVDRTDGSGAGETFLGFLRERWGIGRLVRQERRAEAVDLLVILGEDAAERIAAEPAAR